MSSAVSISTATHDNVVMIPIQAVTSREAKKREQKAAPREGELVMADAKAAPANPGQRQGRPAHQGGHREAQARQGGVRGGQGRGGADARGADRHRQPHRRGDPHRL